MAPRNYLNMTSGAWRQLRRNWRLPLTSHLLVQSYVAGPLFSALRRVQGSLARVPTDVTSLAGSVFVLGYWRSGTTLLHNYMCSDKRFGYASTYACMNPHHFSLTERAALAAPQATVRRPMDDVDISPASPQEDEFALLGLGARSPYEALLAPSRLEGALALGDPRDLAPRELEKWRTVFIDFLSRVSATQDGRPLILKSPPHGYRVATLREIFPDARFVVLVRSPERVFESAVRMWRSLFDLYALETAPPEDHVRETVLADRLRFEAKLTEGLEGVREGRIALVRYEELVQDPSRVMNELYQRLELGELPAAAADLQRDSQYVARNAPPPAEWLERVRRAWAPIFERYGY